MIVGLTVVAGPTLILAVVVVAGVAIYNATTKKRDEKRSAAAEAAIRRCPQCGGLIGKQAETCRHCGTSTPFPE